MQKWLPGLIRLRKIDFIINEKDIGQRTIPDSVKKRHKIQKIDYNERKIAGHEASSANQYKGNKPR